MKTYERASTGLPSLDKVLDQLRLGDNVVWQVDRIEDYRHFVEPFVQQALAENRKIVYMRFGQHPEIVKVHPRIKVYQLDPNLGFEAFSTEVHAIAALEGEEVFYVFDCLSELLSAWATDLMIGNFFRVTCPYLYELNTIAYFTILRDRHFYRTIARIRETTQLLLDVYHQDEQFYVHPLKVWNRYTPTMFLPHVGIGEDFVPITSSIETARLFSHFQPQILGDARSKLDNWDRVFLKAQEIMERVRLGETAAVNQEPELVEQLCKMIISRDELVLPLVRKYFSLPDLLEIRNRLIGSGLIGGKSVGMLLARNILKADQNTDWSKWLEHHDSFYIGSDVYYTYLVENDCWKLRLEQKKEEHYFSAAVELKERIRNGVLPETIREHFNQILEYFGQSPIIVRSSSLLEDAFGNAFAGKYESVFCVNQGNFQERYNFFEEAVKTVYASTMSEDALTYRRQRGLAQSDEQMALLVQRVSGSNRAHYFFPDLAGVAMSRNLYVWREGIDSQAGMMRLVMGLGTRAVDRVDDDYPRVVALDQPLLRPDAGLEDLRKFSQHKIDLLDTAKNSWGVAPLNSIADLKAEIPGWELIAVRDNEIAQRIRELGYPGSEAWILSFEKLLGHTDFPQIMQQMLQTLEIIYNYPVDIEFTANYGPDGKLQINLLQCRPLQTGRPLTTKSRHMDLTAEKLLFSTQGNFMGSDLQQQLNRIIYVQPEEYSLLSISDKYQVARLVGRLNRLFSDRHATPIMLIGPGRWGTSTPSLGVPVSFAEICNVAVLVEVALQHKGFLPELSFGTHFFQDLVETQIFYVALFPGKNGVYFDGDFLEQAPNSFAQLFPEYSKWEKVIKVINLDRLQQSIWLSADLQTRKLASYLLAEVSGK